MVIMKIKTIMIFIIMMIIIFIFKTNLADEENWHFDHITIFD